MRFLNAGRTHMRHNDRFAHQGFECAAVSAQEAHCEHVRSMSCFHGFDDIGGIAGSGKTEKHIALVAEAFNLPGKNLVKAKVVADSRKVGGIGVQGKTR